MKQKRQIIKANHWFNLTAVAVLFSGFPFSAIGYAAEWPGEAKAQMEAAGARLAAATKAAERVAALREIERIAAGFPDAVGAGLTARLMADKATQETGPSSILTTLGELAEAGKITDPETLASVVAPLLSAIDEMVVNGTLLPDTAIQLDAAIKKFDAAAAKVNLPKLADLFDNVTGGTELADKLADTIGKVAGLAKAARDSADLSKMNEDAKKEYLDNLIAILPPGAGPAINGPAFVVFRDSLVWNSEMFGESTKALDLVAEAIETGQFDHEAYAKIEERLNELAKGPWNGDTASAFFKELCKNIPVLGAWCEEVFKKAPETGWKLTGGELSRAEGSLRAVDGDGGELTLHAPAQFLGNKAGFYGGSLSFQAIELRNLHGPWGSFGRVTLEGTGKAVVLDIAPDALPKTWTTYSVALSAKAWAVPESTLRAILSDLTAISINIECGSEVSEVVGFRGFRLAPAK